MAASTRSSLDYQRWAIASLLPIYGNPGLALWRGVEATILSSWKPTKPSLDLGCGDGAVASVLPWRFNVGVDLDLPVLRQAKSRHCHEELLTCDARYLPFRSGSFGSVLSNSVLEHIEQVDVALAEVSRCLKGAGSLSATAPSVRFTEYLLVASILRRLGLHGSARAYGILINRISIHRNVWDIVKWRALLAQNGLSLQQSSQYLPRAASELGDLIWLLTTLTPLGRLYSHLRKKPVRPILDLFLKLSSPRRGDGAGLFFVASKIPVGGAG